MEKKRPPQCPVFIKVIQHYKLLTAAQPFEANADAISAIAYQPMYFLSDIEKFNN